MKKCLENELEFLCYKILSEASDRSLVNQTSARTFGKFQKEYEQMHGKEKMAYCAKILKLCFAVALD